MGAKTDSGVQKAIDEAVRAVQRISEGDYAAATVFAITKTRLISGTDTAVITQDFSVSALAAAVQVAVSKGEL